MSSHDLICSQLGVCRSAFGGAAYAASVIYVPCSDGLVALQVDNKPAFSVLWRLPGLFAGIILIFVPAIQALYGPHDAALGHHRRYSKRTLRAAFEAAGLDIVAIRAIP